MQKHFRVLAKHAAEYWKENETPHLYIVYCGGHGASEDEKQKFLFNTDVRKDADYPIEYKFRYLSKNYKTKVCCIFDVCRSDLKKLFIENKPIFASGAVAGELACEAAAREKGSAEGENAGGKAGLKAGEAKH